MKKSIILLMLLAAALLLAGCASNADSSPSASPSAGMTSPGTSPGMSQGEPGNGGTNNGAENGGGLLTATGQPGTSGTSGTAGQTGQTGTAGGSGADAASGSTQWIETAEDALTASKELRDAVIKLTEIDSAVAVAVGNAALVGVTYDASYQGGIDDRLRGMILSRAKAVNAAITNVAVTDDPDEVNEISSLYQMLQNGSPYTTVKANAETLSSGMDMYK